MNPGNYATQVLKPELKSLTYVLTKVFWHDLPHTTTPHHRWYFSITVINILSIFSQTPPDFKNFLNLLLWFTSSTPLPLLLIV